MAQTKFDKEVEKTAESLMFGIGRFRLAATWTG
jgi:hypothetical protein